MSNHPLKCYLRSHRKRCGFTQAEIAFLIDRRSRKAVSSQEWAENAPDLRTLIAYELIYGAPVAELFAGVYDEVELAVVERACALCEYIEVHDFSAVADHKLAALRRVMSRRQPQQHT